MSMDHFNFLLAEFEPPPPESGNEVGNISGSLRDEEEIKSFTIDEDISDVERYKKYLTGHIFQQRMAIDCLPGLLHEHGKSAFNSIAYSLKKTLASIDTEGQVAVAAAMGVVCQRRRLGPAEQGELVLPIVLKQLSVKEPVAEVLEAWLGCLEHLAPNLDAATLGKGLADLVSSKAEMGVESRVTACRILGAIAPGMGRAQLESRIFSRAVDMCQDTDYQVRIAMSRQLAALAGVMGREVTETTLLKEVFELLRDEEVQVRTAAMESLVQMLPLLSPDATKGTVTPKFVEFCERLQSDPRLVPCLAATIGGLVPRLAPHFSGVADLEAAVQAFCALGARDEEEVRKKCAAAFLPILKVVGGKRYSTYLNDIFVHLAADSDEEVRQTIAGQFHEVCQLLGRARCLQFLKYPLIKLLKDRCKEVKEVLCLELGTTLSAFAGTEAEQLACRTDGDEFFGMITATLLELDADAGTNWRLKMSLVQAMAGFPKYYTSEQIFEHFLPIVKNSLQNGADGVKRAATRTIAMFLRHIRRPAQKLEIYTTLLREFARSRSSCDRLTFLQVCREVMAAFSGKFFRLYFLDPCVETVYDRVPNVRMELCSMLPQVKTFICLPQDVDKLERLTTAMSSLMNDDDRDVSEMARRLGDQFKKVQVSMGGDSLPPGRDAAEDKRREAEEAAIGFPKEDFERVKHEDPGWVDKKPKDRRPPFAASGRVPPQPSGAPQRRTAGGARSRSSTGVEALPPSSRRSADTSTRPAVASSARTRTAASARGNATSDTGVSSKAPAAAASGISRINRLGNSPSLTTSNSLQRRAVGETSPASSRGALSSTAGRLAKAQHSLDGSGRGVATSPGARGGAAPSAGKPATPKTTRPGASPPSPAAKSLPASRRTGGNR